MTETLKCPFCQQKLRKDSDGYYTCYTDNCGCMKYGGNGASGSESLWLALIRTHEELVIALNCLNGVIKDLPWVKRTLDEITALEQKEQQW